MPPLDLHWLLAGFGTVTLLYGAVGMLAQSNLRVALAYASICHVGLAVLGLPSYTAQGAQGAVSLLLSFSVATGGALLLLEFLRQRTGSTDIHSLGGAAKTMPMLASGVLICGLAGVGMPGTSSFPGEFMLILAALQSHTGAGMAALVRPGHRRRRLPGALSQGIFRPGNAPRGSRSRDLRPREWAVLIVMIALIASHRLYPIPWLEIVRPVGRGVGGRSGT
jgi:NADH-quinone oxidoreductase subunit M